MTVKVTRPPINLREKLSQFDLPNHGKINVDSNGNVTLRGDVSLLGELSSGTLTATNMNTTNLTVNGGDVSFTEDTGTTTKFFWDASAESLGIGTSSPTQALHVTNGNMFLDGTDKFIYLSNDFDQWISANAASNYMRFGAANLERMRIDSSGNVGIGTSSPSNKLSVMGNITASGSISSTLDLTAANGVFARDGNDYLQFSDNDYARFVLNGSERMRITSAGNVGIGTASPAAGLEIRLPKQGSANTTPFLKIQASDNMDNLTVDPNMLEINATAGAVPRGYMINATLSTGVNDGHFRVANKTPVFTEIAFGGNSPSYVSPIGGFGPTTILGVGSQSTDWFDGSSPAIGVGVNFDISWTGSTPSYRSVYGVPVKIRGDNSGASSYAFYADVAEAADNYSFYGAAGKAYFADSVGIGTTSPLFKLHLYEAATNPQIRIQNGSTGAIDITPTSIGSSQHLAIGASSYLLLSSTTNDIIHRAVMSHKFENQTGSEWMRITATGNVGIGTSAPVAKLEVKAATDNQNPIFQVTEYRAGGAALAKIYESGDAGMMTVGYYGLTASRVNINGGTDAGAASIQIYNGASANVLVTSSGDSYFNGGNIGIGTSAPTNKLDVVGIDGQGIQFRTSTRNLSLGTSSGEPTLSWGTGSQFRFVTGGSEYVRITSAGNVGIGTSAPTGKLSVSSGNSNHIYLIGTSGDSYGAWVSPTGTSLTIGSWANGARIALSDSSDTITFGTGAASTERMRIDSTGNVGIGTVSPISKLGVAGNAIFSGLAPYVALAYDQSGSTPSYWELAASGVASLVNVGTGANGVWSFKTGSGSEAMRIDSSGRLLIGTTTATGANLLQVNSDARINGLTIGRGTAAIETNTAVGVTALNANTTGNSNTAVGHEALFSNTTGTANTATGLSALRANLGGTANTATGRNALLANTTGLGNTAMGLGALVANTTGSYNTCIGHDAGQALTTGSNNTIIGRATGTAGLADTVIIAAGTTERMRITSAGNLTLNSNGSFSALDGIFGVQIGNTSNTSAGIALETANRGYLWYIPTLSTSLSLWDSTVNSDRLTITSAGNVGIGTSAPAYKLEVNGSFAATTKSFVIDHPTKPDMKLRYGSLESPYHGVRLTGESEVINGICVVELPDYIHGLCKQEESQVQITNIRHGKVLWVDSIDVDNNQFTIATEETGNYKFYWSFTAIRKDIEDMITEFKE